MTKATQARESMTMWIDVFSAQGAVTLADGSIAAWGTMRTGSGGQQEGSAMHASALAINSNAGVLHGSSRKPKVSKPCLWHVQLTMRGGWGSWTFVIVKAANSSDRSFRLCVCDKRRLAMPSDFVVLARVTRRVSESKYCTHCNQRGTGFAAASK